MAQIVVSHRVRKKVSGPLHKETVYGDTGENVITKTGTYRQFVTRKRVETLSKGELEDIRDVRVRETVKNWVAGRGGDPKKAFPPYPKVSDTGSEIRKVRLTVKQQLGLMAAVSTGYADRGANHHVAIYRTPDGRTDFEVVSLFEAARRLAQRVPVVRRVRTDGEIFVMSLSPGDAIAFSDGDRQGLWIVQGVWANGQIVMAKATDAVGATVSRPNPGAILRGGGKKVSVDPVGRIRKAND